MEIKQIDSLSLQKLTNAYHVSFLSAVKATIDQTGIENLGLAEMLYNEFEANLSAEQLIVNRPRASVYSAQLDKLDKARDSYFRGIIYKLMAAQLCVTEGITAEIIDSIERNIIRVYPLTIASEGASVETAKIRGFINDLRTHLATSFAALNISSDVTLLEDTNDEYEEKYVLRTEERAKSTNAATARTNTERAYVTLSASIVTIANTPVVQAADKAKMTAAGALIDQLNQLIKEYKSKTSSANVNDNDNDNDNDNENPNPEENDPEPDPADA